MILFAENDWFISQGIKIENMYVDRNHLQLFSGAN